MGAKHKLERKRERVNENIKLMTNEVQRKKGRIKEGGGGEREGGREEWREEEGEGRKESLLYSLCSTTIQISSSETNSSHSISITRLVLVTQVLNLLRNKVT